MKLKLTLTNQIGICLVLGILAGYLCPVFAAGLKPIGDVFIKIIQMMVLPIIIMSIIAAAGIHMQLRNAAGYLIGWFTVAPAVSIILGLAIATIFTPGVGLGLQPDPKLLAPFLTRHIDLGQFFMSAIPTNIFDSLARGDLLQLMFFLLFVIWAAQRTEGIELTNFIRFADTSLAVLSQAVNMTMTFSPLAIFAIMASVTAKYGFSAISSLSHFISTAVIGFAILAIIQVIMLVFTTRIDVYRFIHFLKRPLALAFGTASGAAAIPDGIVSLRKAGVNPGVGSAILSLGSIVNLNGAALYSALSVVFVSQMYGFDLDMPNTFGLFILLFVTTKGLAAVPGACIVTIIGAVSALGLPTEGIAIILTVDRIIDAFRTTCNFFGNCAAAAAIDDWSKE